MREVESPAGVRERLLRIADKENLFPLGNLSFLLEAIEQGSRLRKQRNRVARVGLGAIEADCLRPEINMFAAEIGALGGADSRLTHELNQIGGVIVFQFHHERLSSNFVAEIVPSQMLYDVEELLPIWGDTNGLVSFELLETGR